MTEAGPIGTGFRTGMSRNGIDQTSLASMSITMSIFLLTSQPPVSTAMFQVRSQSSRSTLGLGLGRDERLLERVRAPAQELTGQGDRLGDVLDREVAVELEPGATRVSDGRAVERHHRVLVGLEEVRAAQMVVALLEVRRHARRLDLDVDA